MQTPLVSVVIATYNREDLLCASVGDVLGLDPPDASSFEVLVVDQSESHGPSTEKQLETWHQSGAIRWIKTSPPGLTRARNLGIRQARGEFLIFIDDDVRIETPSFLNAHVQALSRPGIGGVAGRIIVPDEPLLTVTRNIGDLGFFGTREPGFGSDWSGPTATVRGCNMSFRREVLQAMGGFDERYTRSAFREDTDISYRLRRHHYQLWFAHDAWLYHLSAVEGGTRDRSIPVFEDLILNDVRFARRNLSQWQQVAWLARIYGSRVIKASLYGGRWKERHGAYRQSLDIVRAEGEWNDPGGFDR